jgi:diguanylate cyclase (GGDEF)-like protein
MKLYKYLIFLLIVVFALSIGGFIVLRYIDLKKNNLLNENYRLQALSLKEKLINQISQKKESTTDIALGLASNSDLAKKIISKNIPLNYYATLIKKIKKVKSYRNMWIQVVNKDGVSMYRSWTSKRYDNLLGFRKDLEKIFITKKSAFTISIGKFDLSFKTIIPIYKNNSFLGIVEIITHFNSISNNLKKNKISSVVVAIKENDKQLKYPFSNLFIGKYYVSNTDAPLKFRSYLQNHGIQNYFNDSYKVENGYLIVSYPIKSMEQKIIGYYIMFQKPSATQNTNLNVFIIKLFAILLIIFLLLTIIGITIFLLINKRQKEHFKNIIDSSTNIMITNNIKKMIDANKAFFKLFYKYSTVDEFLLEHKCICDFFAKEDGYLQMKMGDKTWLKYILQNQDIEHKAKVQYLGKNYYFLVSASLIDTSTNEHCIVLTDISKQEEYKKELELLTITDPLTNIKNRRFYETSIKEEINRVKRHSVPLSVIMFDIDHFKEVNDRYGHDVGDEILISYVKLISSMIREEDKFCRVGGEEFIIILSHLKLESAGKLAEKLRKEVQDRKEIVPITISFGVVQYIQGETKEQLYKRLDDALYRAKQEGRNRVVISR